MCLLFPAIAGWTTSGGHRRCRRRWMIRVHPEPEKVCARTDVESIELTGKLAIESKGEQDETENRHPG